MQIQKAVVASVVMSVALLAMSGCTCTSDGLELDAPRADRSGDVSIEWDSVDGFAGTMTATVAESRAYLGSYLLITPDTRIDQLAPLWEGWDTSRGWRNWHQQTGSGFVDAYDGMVLANLRAAHGDRMRCRFLLDFPSLGMNGGGAGKCQFLGGKTVDVNASAGRAD